MDEKYLNMTYRQLHELAEKAAHELSAMWENPPEKPDLGFCWHSAARNALAATCMMRIEEHPENAHKCLDHWRIHAARIYYKDPEMTLNEISFMRFQAGACYPKTEGGELILSSFNGAVGVMFSIQAFQQMMHASVYDLKYPDIFAGAYGSVMSLDAATETEEVKDEDFMGYLIAIDDDLVKRMRGDSINRAFGGDVANPN